MTKTRFQSYPETKDSSIEWLGQIPVHWEAVRLRYLAAINPTKSEVAGLASDTEVSFVPMPKVSETGELVLDEEKELDQVFNGYTYFRNADVLLAKITPCFENGKAAVAEGLTNGLGFGSTEFHVLRPQPACDKRFLYYAVYCDPFRRIGTTYMTGAAGQQRVPEQFVLDWRQPVPDLTEQQSIADFLDRETAKIDALVEKKEQLIELLQEKRTALITHAVTEGLDPDDPMKDSGIEWLGEIPAHWAETRLGWSVQVNGGHTPDTGELRYWDGEIPWVTPKDMKRRAITDSLDHVSEAALSETGLRLLATGSVLIVVRGMILAHTFPVAVLLASATINQDMKALLPTDGLESDYLAYLLEGISEFILSLVEESAHGTRRLQTELWKRIQLFLPPTTEQTTIIEHLDLETARIDALIAKVGQAIERLKEYRTALISAAVTGKIDVRGIERQEVESFR